ncbi:MAG: hypothetical protein RIQ47_1407 [Bacteroidota bacterium]
MNRILLSLCTLLAAIPALFSCAQPVQPLAKSHSTAIITGAEQLDRYLPRLHNRKVGVVANPTSLAGDSHLVDILVNHKINVKLVFAPEHGFRGEAGNGDKVTDGKDPKTGIRIVSLYGKKNKPAPEDLLELDAVLFDIQDVGARFYTYISTLQYVMEACADAGIEVIVLDRPNPNGHYVDGPVLKNEFRSFVGMNPIPIVHGCTIGEYASMLIGEGWINSDKMCKLTVITMKNYSHATPVNIFSRPSPNLTNMNAIRLYPSLCLFEGTHVSLGRGTSFPFEVYGFPGFSGKDFRFTPKEISGVASNPPYEDTLCFGVDLRNYCSTVPESLHSTLNLKWLLEAYRDFPDKPRFFNSFFNKLAGNNALQEQIKRGDTEEQIKATWQNEIAEYKVIRKKYLLYEDFE